MVRVKIELVSRGDEERVTTLHIGVIANDGTGTRTRGNYDFVLSKRGSAAVYKRGRVEGFPRKVHTAWKLLYLVLKEIFESDE